MYNLLKVEFYKLKHSKIFYMLCILMIMQSLCVLIPVKENFLRFKSGYDMFLFAIELQEGIYHLFVIGILSYYITNEFYSGNIRNLIASGHKRINIVFAKAIVFCTGVVLVSFIFPVGTLIINTIKNGYGTSFDFIKFIQIIIILIFAYAAMAAIWILISFLTKNVFITIASCYVIDIINRAGMAISLKSKEVDYFYSKTVFSIPRTVGYNKFSFYIDFKMIFMSLITITVCVILSCIFFRKSDVK